MLNFTCNPQINTGGAFAVICGHVQNGETIVQVPSRGGTEPPCLCSRTKITEDGEGRRQCSIVQGAYLLKKKKKYIYIYTYVFATDTAFCFSG